MPKDEMNNQDNLDEFAKKINALNASIKEYHNLANDDLGKVEREIALRNINEKIRDLEEYTGKSIEEIFEDELAYDSRLEASTSSLEDFKKEQNEFAKEVINLKNEYKLGEFAKKINSLSASIKQYKKLDEEIREINNMTMQDEGMYIGVNFSEGDDEDIEVKPRKQRDFNKQIEKRVDNVNGLNVVNSKPTKKEKEEEKDFVESYRKDLYKRDLFTSKDTTDKYVHQYLDRQEKNGLKFEPFGEEKLWKEAKEIQQNKVLYEIQDKINDLEQYTGKSIQEIFEDELAYDNNLVTSISDLSGFKTNQGDFARDIVNLKDKEHEQMEKYMPDKGRKSFAQNRTVKRKSQILGRAISSKMVVKKDKRGLSTSSGIKATFRMNDEKKYINKIIGEIDQDIVKRREIITPKQRQKEPESLQLGKKGTKKDMDIT